MANSPPCLRGIDGKQRLILRVALSDESTTCVSRSPRDTVDDLIDALLDKGAGEAGWVLTTGNVNGGESRQCRCDELLGDIAHKDYFLSFGPGEDGWIAPIESPRSAALRLERGVIKVGGDCKYGASKIKGTYHKDPSSYTEDPEMVVRYFPSLGDRVFSRPLVGVESQHGMMPDDSNKRSEGKINQDRGCYKYPFCNDSECAFFGCFDGHGAEGHLVSDFVISVVTTLLEEKLMSGQDPESALKSTFVEMEEQLVAVDAIDSTTSGCTAVGVLIRGNEVWTANVGDSRAVIGEEGGEGGRLLSVDLTVDQKPNSPVESNRIRQMGGYVTPETKHESSRVFVEKDGLGGLALARAIGDTVVSAVGVISEPVVTHHTLKPEDKCLIVGSDGIWEYIENQEAVEIASQNGSASRAANALKEEAMDRWKKHGLYRDDITVGVIYPPLW